jgi:hypothetical protein
MGDLLLSLSTTSESNGYSSNNCDMVIKSAMAYNKSGIVRFKHIDM